AEITKYAANAMLATRISFMNSIAALCDAVGADVDAVRKGIGSDTRIGPSFLFPGIGYGGSCFPKDVKALIRTMADYGVTTSLLQAVEDINERQKKVLVDKVVSRFGADLSGRVFAIWGLSFKPETDAMSEAPSLTVVRELAARGARIRAHDPVALHEAQRHFGDLVADGLLTLVERQYDCLDDASALLLLTEWRQYRLPDFELIRSRLAEPVLF